MRILVFLVCLSLALGFSPRRLGRGLERLIVGGNEAPKGSRPYQVALFDSKFGDFYSQFCGGTLVHPKWVVTAAHCAGGDVYVGLGYHDLFDSGKQIIKGKWITHARYNPNTLNNDVALIKLEEEAFLSLDAVETISIASAGSDVDAGTDLLVSGWGALASDGDFPSALMQVVVTAVGRSECKSSYSGEASITKNMICAADPGEDSCQGDSGGPIVSHFNKNKNVPGVVLEGIVSWGFGCADPSYPGVYTRVANYCSWIAKKTSNDVTCIQ